MTHSTGQLADAAVPNRREADGDLDPPARLPPRRRSLLWRVWKDPRFDGLRTMLWVGPLTVMIWIYAEREQIKVTNLNGIPVTVASGDPGRVVSSVNRSTNPPTVNLKVSGPQEAIERVQDQLLHVAGGGPRLRIQLGNQLVVGDNRVPIVQAFLNDPIFKNNGLTVEDAQPPDLLVAVDQMVDADLPVALSADARRRLNLDGPVQFTPAKVRVRGPAAVLGSADHLRVAAVEATLPDDADALSKPGPHDAIPLQLVPPGTGRDDPVTLAVPTVTARYTVRAAEKALHLARVPVWVLASPDLTHEYDVQQVVVTIPVDVVGPPDLIDRLARKDDPLTFPVAVLTIGREDVDGSSKAVEVQRLPPGVHLDGAEPLKVGFHLAKRAAGDGG